MKKFRIGRDIGISADFVSVPEYAASLGYGIFQVFLAVPDQVLSKPMLKEVLIKFGKEMEKFDLEMVIHGSYTINLCQPVGSPKYKTSVNKLVRDLISSSHIGQRCLGVIIHMGKNIPENRMTDKQALANYITGLKTALAASPSSTTIILETGASQGHEIASRLEGLAEIYHGLTNDEQSRVMFCVDTCHIYASGYDIATAVGVKNFFKNFDKLIGTDRIACIHFNDSRTPFYSKVDRHEDLSYGYIGLGLKAVALFAKRNKIPLITETPLDAIDKKTNHEITYLDENRVLMSWLA